MIWYSLSPNRQGYRLTIWEPAPRNDNRTQPFHFKLNFTISSPLEAAKILDLIPGSKIALLTSDFGQGYDVAQEQMKAYIKSNTESQEFNVRERECLSQGSPRASFCQRLYRTLIKNKAIQGRCHRFAKTGLKPIKSRKSYRVFTTLKVKQQVLIQLFDKFAESYYEDMSKVVSITFTTLLKTKLLLRQSIRHLIRMLVSH